MRALAAVLALVGGLTSSSGCALAARHCLGQQKRGRVLALEGLIEARQVITQVVPYDQQGSQNNLSISWPGQKSGQGPRLRVFATSIDCVAFVPPAADRLIARNESRHTRGRQDAPNCRHGVPSWARVTSSYKRA